MPDESQFNLETVRRQALTAIVRGVSAGLVTGIFCFAWSLTQSGIDKFVPQFLSVRFFLFFCALGLLKAIVIFIRYWSRQRWKGPSKGNNKFKHLFEPVPLPVRLVVCFATGIGILPLLELFQNFSSRETNKLNSFFEPHYANLFLALALFSALALFMMRNRWSARLLFSLFVLSALQDVREQMTVSHHFDGVIISYLVLHIAAIVALFSKSVRKYLDSGA